MKQFIIKLMILNLLMIPKGIQSSLAITTYGTLNSIENGFGHIQECQAEPTNAPNCSKKGGGQGLLEILNLATVNQCIALEEEMSRSNLDIPDCPDSKSRFKMLDHSYPSGALFALYNGRNSGFLQELVSEYLNDNPPDFDTKNDKIR